MKAYFYWGATATAALAIASCQCGPGGANVGGPCQSDGDCSGGLVCVDRKCASKGGTGGGTGAGGGQGTGGGGGGTSCVNLECKQVQCAGGQKTTLTGKVYAPNGTLPLYNAIVYVPNAPLSPFTPGVSCDKCGAPLSGSPLVQAVTRADGSFTLENVPAGADIPLVIQMGRWRRQVTIPKVDPCVTTAITDVNLLRLPRNKSEGDIPQMAIVTGSADPFECLFRKIGLDDAEITLPTSTGRVHYYRNNGIDMSTPAPSGTQLYGSLDQLKKYDVVVLACEGSQILKDPAHTQNVIEYTNVGGRVFATHFSYVWIQYAQQPFPSTATWRANAQNPSPQLYTLDTGFPKGNAFADWLVNVGASTTRAELSVIESRRNVVSVNPSLAQRWFYTTVSGLPTVGHYTFNTPVAALLPDGGAPDQCGRVVFSDFHVSAAALSGQPTFPASCKDEPSSPQERALAFMLFDLSACVQRDEIPPIN